MNDLQPQERATLRKEERVIEQCMAEFVRVGISLMRIRDGKLYRENHDTFEAYLKERWGLSRSRGYALIEAAQVQTSLARHKNLKASQAQQLAKAPEDERDDIIDTVKKQGKLTSKKLKEEVQRRMGEQDEWGDIEDDHPADVIVQDALGNTVPSRIETAFTDDRFAQIASDLRRVAKAAKQLSTDDIGVHLPTSQVEAQFRQAIKLITTCAPHAVCPKCAGKGCEWCKRSGYLTEAQYEATSKDQ